MKPQLFFLKKPFLVLSTATIDNAVCRAQSNDGQIYVGVGKLNGRPVKILRDTGCTGMIVDRALVPDVMVIPDSSGSLQGK